MRTVLVALLLSVASTPLNSISHVAERVRPNDNRRPAGVLRDKQLTLGIEARLAEWHPDGDGAPGAIVPAFSEVGRSAEIPGPLVRVPAGTEIVLTLRNSLERDTLTMHGIHTRPGVDQPFALVPGESRTVRFKLDAPGTYYYYGSTMNRIVDFRTLTDAQLSGAIVVDEPGARPGTDRIMVIGMWTDTTARAYTQRKRLLAVMNGRSWPHTERLSAQVGDTVTWRVINASSDAHPMHLHGFYFRVDSRGDGTSDTIYRKNDREMVVTDLANIGATVNMMWVPERSGNWLFHCHIPEHFAPRAPLGQELAADAAHAHTDHALGGMGGLVMGVSVKAKRNAPVAATVADAQRKQIRLLVRPNKGGSKAAPYFGFALQRDGVEPKADSGLLMGPPLVLTRDVPVAITVVNTLDEPTAVHWHGIELDSYFDGVAGFSGEAKRISPIIAPRDSFVARFTPPRAGTFIYHTHVDEQRQQPAGLAGALIVLEPGAVYDTTTNKIVIVSSPWNFADQQRGVMLNGSMTPAPIELKVGQTYRFRFINMTLRRPALRVDMFRDSTFLTWRNIAKDGADLPPEKQIVVSAKHGLAIGETFDVEVVPTEPGEQRLEVRLGGRQAMGPLMGVMRIGVVK